MNTEAVMCMALTRHSPSLTPLSRAHSSTWPVMFTNSIRAGILKVRYLVKDFMICLVFYDKGSPSPTNVLLFSLAGKPATLESPPRKPIHAGRYFIRAGYPGPIWTLRRPLRSGNARARSPSAHGRVSEGARRSGIPEAVSLLLRAIRRSAIAFVFRRALDPGGGRG